MASEEATLQRLIVTAHEAAADSALWPGFLKGFIDAMRADIALIQRHSLDEQRSELLSTFGMTQQFTRSYNEHYSRMNVWRNHGRRLYVEGRVIFDEEMYPRELLKRTEFYNDFLVRNRGTRCVAGVFGCRGDRVMTLVALRDESGEPFERAHADAIGVLTAHVARALATEERLHLLEAGEAVLGNLSLGVVLLGRDGRVVFQNRAGEEITRAADGLALRHERLTASGSGVAAALLRLLRYATAPGESLECPPGVLVPRPSGRRPYHVTAAPLRSVPKPFIAMTVPVAVVFITEPARCRPVATDALRLAYGLTEKEAAVAAALAQGETLERIAERLGMRYETARSHLRQVMSKTQTSRQAELVLLLARLAR